MFTETEQQIIELHRGHDCETWRLLLEDKARAAVNRVTFREYELRHGTKQTVDNGHAFLLDERGEVDVWRTESDQHNGPGCAICDGAWCHHCEPEVYEQVCPALAATVAG